MRIRCWGARSSIPVSGPEYLRYGGDTTCLELWNRSGDVIVVDAGSGIRRLGKQLLTEETRRVRMLFTHAHWDHLLGFPFFGPLYRDSWRIEVFGCPCAQSSIKEMISQTMSPPNFPVPLEDVHAEVVFHADCEETFSVGGLSITPTHASHPNKALGYRFEEDGRSLVFLTDNELRYRHEDGGTFDDYVRFCRAADLLIHDAEFTPEEYRHTRAWGHSTYADAAELALAAEVRALGLFHHNQDRSDDQVDEIVAACGELLAARDAGTECFAVHQGMERRL